MQKFVEVLSKEEVAKIISQPKLIYRKTNENSLSSQPSKKIRNIMFDATRDYAILRLLYSTGMVVGQVCALSLEDLDLVGHRIRINGRHGTRYVAVWPGVEKALRQWLKVRNKSKVENEALFTTHLGNPIHSREIQRKTKVYTSLSGIQKQVSPKTFRHSIALHLSSDGANTELIGDFLRVSLPSVDRYLPEISFDELRKVLAKVHIKNW